MSFASLAFVLFAAAFFCLWPWVRDSLSRRFLYLLVLSMAFYGYANPIYVPLFLLNVVISYACGRAISRYPEHASLFLGLGIVTDLSVLIGFKYQAFLAQNLNALLDTAIPTLQLPLPIGISFYTFMSISYLVDVYHRHTTPARSFWHYAAYLSMFPHLVAGPIVRAHDLLPQLLAPRLRARLWPGLELVVRGFFKKLVLADNLAPAVNQAFASGEVAPSGAYWWMVASMFGLQIYFDFSGYTDIARGLARWLGFEFQLNFDHPYSARSFRDFWHRWHISLSQWFRDYVYRPLGGSRGGSWLTLRNLWITMLISGLWHGANWTYVIWGALHALYLTLERITRWPERLGRSAAGGLLCTAIVFALTTLAWVFFRAPSVSYAFQVVSAMLAPTDWSLAALRDLGAEPLAFWLLGMLLLANHRLQLAEPWSARFSGLAPYGYGVLAGLSIYWRGPGSAFIYFQF